GAGASLKRLSLSRISDIETTNWPVAALSGSHDDARQKLKNSSEDHVLLLDDRNRPKRWVSADDIESDRVPLKESGWPAVAVVEESASLYDTLDTMVTSYKGSAVVVDGNGAYRGVVDFEAVLQAINSMRPENPQNGSSDREQASE
ncbi:MAG: CBS domain-containing protein, partial [Rubrobacteraceae bacterium]